MATEGGGAPPPAYNESAARQPPPQYQTAPATTQPVVVQQPAANIRYVDQYGNPVAPPQQQQVVVMQQPQPNIRYVDQNGNPVAPPVQAQPQPVIKYVDQNGNPVAPPVQQPQVTQPQPVIKYVDQNGNPVAPPTGGQPGVPLQVGTAPQTGNNNNLSLMQQEMLKNGGYCWKITLIVMWSLTLAGAIPQFIVGCILVDYYNTYYQNCAYGNTYSWGWSGNDYYYCSSYTYYNDYDEYARGFAFLLLVPGLIGVIAAPLSIYGVTKYHYKLNIFSCIALGLLLFDGLILLMVHAAFFGSYWLSFVYYSCMFGFSIKFTRKIAYIQTNGQADDVNADCCKGCYECCGCQKSCGGCCS